MSVYLQDPDQTMVTGLNNESNLVTGEGSGMGRVATRRFPGQGAKVVAVDAGSEPMDETMAELSPEPRDAVLSLVGDVSSGAGIRSATAAGVERFGFINVLYNNAGVMPDDGGSVETRADDVWRRILHANPRGVANSCQYGIPALRATEGSSIITIASFVALMGCVVPRDAYTRSKGVVLSLTRSFAVEYGKTKIRANAICPGPVLTPLLESLFPGEEEKLKWPNRIPLGRFRRAEDVVSAGGFLAPNESSWMTGTTFVVGGGITVNYF